jgi:hypothetical protein
MEKREIAHRARTYVAPIRPDDPLPRLGAVDLPQTYA